MKIKKIKKRIITKILNGELQFNRNFASTMKKCCFEEDYVPTQEDIDTMKEKVEAAKQDQQINARLEEIHKSIKELHGKKDVSRTLKLRKVLGTCALVACGIIPAFIAACFVGSIVFILLFGIRGVMTGFGIKKLITNPNPIKVIKINKEVGTLEKERLELLSSQEIDVARQKIACNERNKEILKYLMDENYQDYQDTFNNSGVIKSKTKKYYGTVDMSA